jgi:hypothetical protein
MIQIENAAQRIIKTDYWDSEYARAGYFYLSWNARAGRLLVPDAQKPALTEMRSARLVIVSSGPIADPRAGGTRPALELLFEDDSDSPYAIHIVEEQTDRKLPETNQGGGFLIAAWTRGGLKHSWPGKYREVDELPCLQAWIEQ